MRSATPSEGPDVCQTSTRASVKASICVLAVMRRRRDAQPLGSPRDGRVIDRLNVDPMLFEQEVAGRLAEFGVTDEHRHDMRPVRHDRNARHGEGRFGFGDTGLMPIALLAGGFQVTHGRSCGRRHGGRQSGREDEGRRVAAHGIHQRRYRRLYNRRAFPKPLASVPSMMSTCGHDAFAFGDAGTSRTIQPDRVDLVAIGQGVIATAPVQ